MGIGKKRNAIVAGITVLSVLTLCVQGNNNIQIKNGENNKQTTLRQSTDVSSTSTRKTSISLQYNNIVKTEKERTTSLSKRKDDVNSENNLSNLFNQARKLFYKVLGQPRIVGGTKAEEGEFPSFSFTIGDTLCGGTLIHPDIIMTAAHCEVSAFADGAFIGGISISGSSSEQFNVVQSVPNPDFNPNNRQNDIMLVKIEGTSSAPLQTINLDPDFPPDSEVVTVIGFGDTLENGTISDDLLKVDVLVGSDTECEAFWGIVYQPEIQICAGVEVGGRDSCQGDSGGPLMTDNSGIQVGIVSFGSGCARPNEPAIYTRVSAYRNWIRQTICDISDVPPANCNEPTPAPVLPPSSPVAPPSIVTALPTSEIIPDVPSSSSDLPSLVPINVGSDQPNVVSDQPSFVEPDRPSFEPTVCIPSPHGKGKGKGGMSGKGMMSMGGKGGDEEEPSSKSPKEPLPKYCPKSDKSSKGKGKGKGGMSMGKGGMRMGKGGMRMGKGMIMGKGGMNIPESKGGLGDEEVEKDASKKGTSPTTNESAFLEYLAGLRGATKNSSADMENYESIVTLIMAGLPTEVDGSVDIAKNADIIRNNDINDVEKDIEFSLKSADKPLEKETYTVSFADIVSHERPLHPKFKSGKIADSDSEEGVIQGITSHERPIELLNKATSNETSYTPQIEDKSETKNDISEVTTLDIIRKKSEGTKSLTSMKIIEQLIAGHEIHQ